MKRSTFLSLLGVAPRAFLSPWKQGTPCADAGRTLVLQCKLTAPELSVFDGIIWRLAPENFLDDSDLYPSFHRTNEVFVHAGIKVPSVDEYDQWMTEGAGFGNGEWHNCKRSS
jgi:hypothetical protein